MGARYLKVEDEAIKAHYPTATRREILRLIPTRTWNQIGVRARRINVYRTTKAKGTAIIESRKESGYLWSDSDNIKFDLLYPGATQEQLLNTFHTKTWSSIRSHAEKRGIHRTREAIGRQMNIGRRNARRENI